MAGHLEVVGLSKSFYGVHALSDVSFSLKSGELLGLIGPNGSGKSTAIDCISGYLKPDAGEVLIDGRRVSNASLHTVAHAGLVRTFQLVRVFPTLSARDNIRAGALATTWRKSRKVIEERVNELIDRFNLRHVADLPAGHLSYGQRKLVELASALIMQPRILLLDEPIAAVNPTLANAIVDEIRALHGEGISILLVKHNIEVVMEICQRLVVLDSGSTVADGPPADVIGLQRVQEAYFGR